MRMKVVFGCIGQVSNMASGVSFAVKTEPWRREGLNGHRRSFIIT